MNPGATLTRILALSAVIIDDHAKHGKIDAVTAEKMAALFRDLHQHIAKGGSLPEQWTAPGTAAAELVSVMDATLKRTGVKP